MKKYLLFAGDYPEDFERGHPAGGWNNFIMHSDDLEEIKAEAYKLLEEYKYRRTLFYSWSQIVDRDTMKEI